VNKKSGAMMIELAILFPLMLVVGYFCFEVARTFQTLTQMSTLCKEAARDGYRKCSGATNMNECLLNNVYAKMAPAVNVVLRGASLGISVYGLASTTSPNIEFKGAYGITQNGTGSLESRFDLQRITNLATTTVTPLFWSGRKEYLVVGEVELTRTFFIPQFFLKGLSNRVLYEVSLY
jgi:Flp pilus assembly protein TadG